MTEEKHVFTLRITDEQTHLNIAITASPIIARKKVLHILLGGTPLGIKHPLQQLEVQIIKAIGNMTNKTSWENPPAFEYNGEKIEIEDEWWYEDYPNLDEPEEPPQNE
jgi:hypothetical protein